MADKKEASDHEKKEDLSLVVYTLGIVSIIESLMIPISGFVFAIVTLIYSFRYKTKLSQRGRVFSIIAIVLSIVMFIVSIYLNKYISTLPTI